MKKVLRCLLTTVFIVSMLAVCAFQSSAATAEYVDADGNIYTYTISAENLTINEIKLKNSGTHLVIPDTINGSTVTRMGNYVFYGTNSQGKLESITIPNTVNYIYVNAFYMCRSLKNVIFGNVSNLDIWSDTFTTCTALESVTFGNTQNVIIHSNAFADITKLKTVDLGNPTGMEIKNKAFANTGITEITVPKGVSLGQYVFYLCPNLVKAEIYGSPLKQVETTTDTRTGKVIAQKDVFSEYLFYKCPVLREVTIANYEIIYKYMFSECPALEKVNVGNATSIIDYAFEKCTSLKEFISNGKVNIGYRSFYGCSGLEYFDLSKVIKLDYASFADCTSLKNIDLSTVEVVTKFCFSGCTSLTELDLSGVKVIEEGAFSECTGLKELHIDHDMNIWEHAFKDCTGLEKIIVEDNVKYVDLTERSQLGDYLSNEIFEGCTNVKYIYIGANFVPNVKENKYIYLATNFFSYYYLSSLEKIEVSPDNPYYRSVDNVLYLDEGDVYILLCYPRAKKGEYYSTQKALAGVNKDFTLGEMAFAGTRHLKEVNFTKPVVFPEFEDNSKDLRMYNLLDSSFYDSSVEKVTFPKGGMKTVGFFMFTSSAIKDIDLSETERVMRGGFSYCQNLIEIDLPSCTDLAGYAFEECKSLKTVNLPLWTGETSDWAGDYVFYRCTALESVNMPLVEYLPDSCFCGCTSLVNVYAPNCIQIDEYCFYGCTSLEKLDMPLRYVGKYAFKGCSNLQDVTLNNARVFEGAFLNCISLQSIDGLKNIGESAFSGCVSLKNIKLYGVSKIGESAFKDCNGLTLAQFDNTKCTFGSKAFENCPNLSFYCDENSDAYNYAVKNNIPIIAISVGFQNDKYEYTGSKIEPSIIVSISGMTLVQNRDYTLTFENNLKVGTATVTVHFIGDFDGLPDARRVFTITRRDITSAEVEYVVDNEYTGEDIRPAVVVRLDGKILVEGVDYSIKYSSGTDTGTMFFTINGRGNYTGSIDCYYNIVRRDIAEAAADKIPDCVYTGSEICPIPTLTWNGFTLIYGEDYEVRYFENVNAGFGTAVIYGKGNFCGTQLVKFRIFGKSIENAVVSEIADQEYTGQAIQPQVTVTVDGKTLTENVDYTVEYKNNIENGTASVIIRGIGNYSGVTEKFFNIYKNSVYSFTVFSETQMTATYDGTPLKPEMEVYFGTELLTEGVDYTVRLENNINAGTATVTICGMGRFEGERSYNFTILPCKVGAEDVFVSGNTQYNGEAIEPQVTVYKNGKLLEIGTEYTVTYHNNIEVGTAYLTVEGIGNYIGTVNMEFEIYAPKEENKGDDNDNKQDKDPTPAPDDSQDDKDKQEPADPKPDNGNKNDNDTAQKDENQNSTDNQNKPSSSEQQDGTQTDNSQQNAVDSPSIPNTDSENETVENILWIGLTVPLLIALNILSDKWRKKHGKKTFIERIKDAVNDIA
ncbi:MAG: leucine-rich repeat protein [Oscillospiraceae bacterium]|nr:leucine-rich repeat protein [Oscillospiraceae bacterium]